MGFLIYTIKIKSCKKLFVLKGFNSYLTFRGFYTLTSGVSNLCLTFISTINSGFRCVSYTQGLKIKGFTIRSAYNQWSYTHGFLQSVVLHSWVLTFRGYSYNQGFLHSGVLHSWVLTIGGSYNQGALQSGVLTIRGPYNQGILQSGVLTIMQVSYIQSFL